MEPTGIHWLEGRCDQRITLGAAVDVVDAGLRQPRC